MDPIVAEKLIEAVTAEEWVAVAKPKKRTTNPRLKFARTAEERLNISNLATCLMSAEAETLEANGFVFDHVHKKQDSPLVVNATIRTLMINNKWGDIAVFVKKS